MVYEKAKDMSIMGGMSPEDFKKLEIYLNDKEVPVFGEIRLIFQDQKLVRVKKEESEKFD